MSRRFILYFFKKWAIPGLFFFIFCLFYQQLRVNKCSIKVAETGFEFGSSGIGSNRSANCATATAIDLLVI